MNNFFDISRFGKYLGYDLRNAKNNAGISVLVIGLTPIISFVFYQLFHFIFEKQWAYGFEAGRIAALCCALVAAILAIPVKLYGPLTDKRAGSDFLMLPASTFEKWLSLVVVCCVVYPICAGSILLGSDAVAGLVFPNSYGEPVISNLGKFIVVSGGDFTVNLGWLYYVSWCESILTFTLGAIFFKRGKVGKTILACFVISSLFSFVTMLVFGNVSFNLSDYIANRASDLSADDVITRFNVVVSAFTLIVNGALLAGIYVRLRTLKH